MISLAYCTASEIAQIVSGTFLAPGYCASLRAARIAAAISRTRLRPSSMRGAFYAFAFCSSTLFSSQGIARPRGLAWASRAHSDEKSGRTGRSSHRTNRNVQHAVNKEMCHSRSRACSHIERMECPPGHARRASRRLRNSGNPLWGTIPLPDVGMMSLAGRHIVRRRQKRKNPSNAY